MNFKKDIENLLLTLKANGYDRGKIEEDLNYSENYIDQVLAKGGNRRFLNALKRYSDDILQKNILAISRRIPANNKENHTEETPAYINTRRQQKITPKPFLVPLVPVKAQAGYASSYNNTDFIDNLELYPILPGIDPMGAVWRYFEIQGDSMEPGLYNTDLVLVSMVPREDWTEVKKGQVHVIVTSDNVFIKVIYLKDEDSLILISSNKRHKQRIIPFSEIKEIWQYRRHVTNKLKI